MQIFAKCNLPSKINFYLEDGPVEQCYFELFSLHGLYFHPTKDCRSTRPYSPFFYIYCYFGQIFCTEVIQFFSIWDIRHSKRAANINWWIFWMRNGGLLLPFFASFYSRAAQYIWQRYDQYTPKISQI